MPRFAGETIPPPDDGDLLTFVSRPDIRAPRFHVEIHEPDLVSPGYWFVAPYYSLEETKQGSLYIPGQTGPHIYDARGNLVWSGAHLFEPERAILDFKTISINRTHHLSFLVLPNQNSAKYPGGAGVIFNSSFSLQRETQSPTGDGVIDMHEFNVIDNGERALILTHQKSFHNILPPDSESSLFAWVANSGFVEVDVATGNILFEWWALDKLSINETEQIRYQTGDDDVWDWLHLNSVDKDSNGDYLISGRFTSTIYKISGKNGAILWRLGGSMSSFQLQGFNFSNQHDARFRGSQDDITYISFMNNAAGGQVMSATTSSALIVGLNTTDMTAAVAHEYPRPDNGLTKLRGNVQILPNSNILAGWSENAYTTEFTRDGRMVLETNFTSRRLVTYRSYKLDYVSNPTDDPTLRSFVYGEAPQTSTTAFYVSWNGATEVASWNFFAATSLSGSFALVRSEATQGFETTAMVFGCFEKVYAQAVAIDGSILGVSSVQSSLLPREWHSLNESRQTNLRFGSLPMQDSRLGITWSGAEIGQDEGFSILTTPTLVAVPLLLAAIVFLLLSRRKRTHL